jgi:hypothetical protein
MQASTYVGDQLRQEAHSARPLVIGVLAGLILLLVGLRVLPEESTPLTAKVMGLLSATISTAAVGAYLGRRLQGWLAILGLFALSILGMFLIRSLGGSDLAIVLLLGWGVVNGMMLGPLVSFAIAEGGPQIVIQALAGTTAVMLGAALVAFVIGVNVSFLAPILLIALIGLIVVGLVGIFVRFSRGRQSRLFGDRNDSLCGFLPDQLCAHEQGREYLAERDRSDDQSLPQFRQFLLAAIALSACLAAEIVRELLHRS